MKRFFVVLILTLVIAGGLTYFMPRDFSSYVLDVTSDGMVSIYCRQSELDGISLGSGLMVQGNVDEMQNLLTKCQGVDGISVSFSGSKQDIDRIVKLLNLTVTDSYTVSGVNVVCGLSSKISGGVVIDGQTVNAQIAYKDGVVTVGSPLILGEY